jgi:hypothetical protein
MCSPLLTLQAAPTSASLVQGACCDICPPVYESCKARFRSLRMNWVVVTDTNGNRRLKMHWRAIQ